MRTQRLFVLSLSALALLSVPQGARAERGRNPLAGQPAIRHRVEMRKLRFEISPEFLVSMNHPYLIGLGGGLSAQFHINDWLGIAASFHYVGSLPSPLEGKIEDSLPKNYPTDPADPASGLKQPTKQQLRDHIVGPNMLIGLYATLTPIGGKFMLFNALPAFYDFYGIAGVGLANLTNPLACDAATKASDCGNGATSNSSRATMPVQATNNDVNLQTPVDAFTGLRVAGLFGIGLHIYFNHWIRLQLEVRDYVYKSNHGGLDVVTTDKFVNDKGVKLPSDNSPVLTRDDEYITSNLYFGLGLTFMLPPSAKISK